LIERGAEEGEAFACGKHLTELSSMVRPGLNRPMKRFRRDFVEGEQRFSEVLSEPRGYLQIKMDGV